MPSTKDAGADHLEIANAVLGGEFSSRLNMNLREDKHWAYGAYSFLQNAIGERPWMAFAPVQIDKTAESLKEMSTRDQRLRQRQDRRPRRRKCRRSRRPRSAACRARSRPRTR